MRPEADFQRRLLKKRLWIWREGAGMIWSMLLGGIDFWLVKADSRINQADAPAAGVHFQRRLNCFGDTPVIFLKTVIK